VIVQPSTLRTFADSMYEQAGAEIAEDLSQCSTILAVKEVPIELLHEDRTYVFFSHTLKAQHYNMPLLDALLEKKIRLIDYESIVDDNGSRLVRFGKFAGFAGMIDTLHAMGDRLLAKQHSTPFLHVGMSYVYSSVAAAKQAVKAAGEEIASFGLPAEFAPMTFVFTSKGNVSQGALEVNLKK
jgi:alpha-aminoadipic semialdehyde synthase